VVVVSYEIKADAGLNSYKRLISALVFLLYNEYAARRCPFTSPIRHFSMQSFPNLSECRTQCFASVGYSPLRLIVLLVLVLLASSTGMGQNQPDLLAKRLARPYNSATAAQYRQLAEPAKQSTLGSGTSVPEKMNLRSHARWSSQLGRQARQPKYANIGFAHAPELPAGLSPTAIVDGDFNEDGRIDLAIANGDDNTIYVLLGNGDNTFQVPIVLYASGQYPNSIAAVRLQTGGHLDLAVTYGDSNTIEIFRGHGDGTFATGSPITLEQTPTLITSGDLNNDGIPDLVVGLVVPSYTQDKYQFTVLVGNGGGGFSYEYRPTPLLNLKPKNVITNWLALGDIDKDGRTDVLVIANEASYTYLNTQQHGFTALAPFTPIVGIEVAELGDMDEDGCLDAVEFSGLSTLIVAKGSCDGTFTQSDPQGTGDFFFAAKLVDIDHDGHLDAVASSAPAGVDVLGQGAGGHLVGVFRGDGKGHLAPPDMYRTGLSPYSLTITDLNGDGAPEIITADWDGNTSTLLPNDGTGHFKAPRGIYVGYPEHGLQSINTHAPPQVADLNADGKPDLILVEMHGDARHLTSILNDGTGKFLAPIRSTIPVGEWPFEDIALGDFRGTGHPDVIYMTENPASGPSVLAFFPGNGDGSFAPPTLIPATDTNRASAQLAVGDFNNDGKLDFLVIQYAVASTAGRMYVFLGHGDGSFTELPAQAFDGATQLIVSDYNHDGKADLIFGINGNAGDMPSGDDVLGALGNGDGTFQTPVMLVPHFGDVAVADLNDDGYPDLIQSRDPDLDTPDLSRTIPAAVTVYLGTGTGSFQRQPSYHFPGRTLADILPVLVGDFNGDGILDLALKYFGPASGKTGSKKSLGILQGMGGATFAVTGHSFPFFYLNDPYLFTGGDFNRDGADDLIEVTAGTSAVHVIPAESAPSLDISLDSAPLVNTAGTATVTLQMPAAASTDVLLSASDPAVTLPSSLHFDAGQQTKQFSFIIGPGYDSARALKLSAQLGTETAATYAVKPNPNKSVGVQTALLDLGFYPRSSFSAPPGGKVSAVQALISNGGYHGTFGSLQCTGPQGVHCASENESYSLQPSGVLDVRFTVYVDASVPEGTYPLHVSISDGNFSPSVDLSLSVGSFTIAASRTYVITAPTGNACLDVSAASTNGLYESLTLTCSGLPSGAACVGSPTLLTTGYAPICVDTTRVAAGDYAFQIIGSDGSVSRSVSAVLRVQDVSASLDKKTATLTLSHSATFTLTVQPTNHYSGTVDISCQSPTASVTCEISNSPLTITDGEARTVQLKVTVRTPVVSSGAARVPASRSGYYPLFCAVPPLMLLGCRRKKGTLLVFSVALLLMVSGCGGGGSPAGPTPAPTPVPTPTPTPQPMTTQISIPVVVRTYSPTITVNPGPIVLTVQQ
jgi:hypothetical protein